MKKKVLVYAHYYAPDVASTGQLLQDMAEGMLDEFDVTVICTVPSYGGVIEEKYKKKRIYKEKLNGVRIIRVRVSEFTKSNKISRIKNLLAYYLNARTATKLVGNQDYVFAISQPPIMGGMLGLYGKKKIKTGDGNRPKFIYCIQDFNPEQIEATGYINIKPLLKMALWFDKRNCRKSDLVITVGRDLVETLKKRFAKETVPKHTMINNWIDERKIYPLSASHPQVVAFKQQYDLEGKFVIMYSGNLGLYYDLEGLIRVVEKFQGVKTKDGKEVVFAFVGDGSVREKLVQYVKEHHMENTVFIPYQDKDNLIYSLNAGDVHWCVNAKGIKGVSCPSKFYGIAGIAKPVLAVLEKDSEVEMLVNEIGCGRVSEPGDYNSVEKNLKWFISKSNTEELISMGAKGHEYLVSHMTKNVSVAKYIEAFNKL